MIKVVPVKFSETTAYAAPSIRRSYFRRNGLGVTMLAAVNGRGAYESRLRSNMETIDLDDPVGVPPISDYVPNKYGKKRYKRAKRKLAKLKRGDKRRTAYARRVAQAKSRYRRKKATAKERKRRRKKAIKPVARMLGKSYKEFMRLLKSGATLTPKQAAQLGIPAPQRGASGLPIFSPNGRHMRRNPSIEDIMHSADYTRGGLTPNRRRRRRMRRNGDDTVMLTPNKKRGMRATVKRSRKKWKTAKSWLDPAYIFAQQGIDNSSASPEQKLEAYRHLQKPYLPKQKARRKVTKKVEIVYGPLAGQSKKVNVTFDAKMPIAFGFFRRKEGKKGALTFIEKGSKGKKIPLWAIVGAPSETFFNQHPQLFQKELQAIKEARSKREAELEAEGQKILAQAMRIENEGDMYTPNRRKRKARKARKGRKKLFGAALAAHLRKLGRKGKSRKGRKGRKARKTSRVSRKKLFGAALAAWKKAHGYKSRKTSKKRKGKRKGKRSYRRNGMYAHNGFEGVMPSVIYAAQGFGGFFVHRVLTGIAAASFQSQSSAGKAAVSVAVAALGIFGTYKVLRGEAAEAVSAGMGISAAYHVAQALIPDYVNQYLGDIPTERIGSLGEYYTRGTSGLGEYYTRGVQGLGEYYTRGTSGLGEYETSYSDYDAGVMNGLGYIQAGVGGYREAMAGPREAAAGFGEYEVQSDGGVMLDGIHGSNEAVEYALNAADSMADPVQQAAAGLGASEYSVEGRYIPVAWRPGWRGQFTDDPLRELGVPPEYTEESGVQELDTWNPTDEQIIVNPASMGGSLTEANSDM